MGSWEITLALGLGRTRSRELMHRKGFPDPVDTPHAGTMWLEDEVLVWIRANRPDAPATLDPDWTSPRDFAPED